jgi:hypothetical protein
MKKGDIVYLLASDEGGVKGSLIALTILEKPFYTD